MLSKEEWNANKDSTSIIYCFEDGTTKEITMAEYLRAHPEHSAEDFVLSKSFRMNYCTMITIRTIIMDTGKLIKISADWLLWFHLQNRGRWKACCEKNSFALLFV
mgnify:FL=1